MPRFKPLPRRTFLKGAGACIALPLLDGMLTSRASAATGPIRSIFICFENGTDMTQWLPAAQGTGYTMPATLQPLAALREYVLVASGLDLDIPYIPDPNTDHTAPNLLTCRQPSFKSGKLNVVNASIDHVIAASAGAGSRLPLLTIGNEGDGNREDVNYSWASATLPNEMQTDPAAIFNMLFRGVTTSPSGPSPDAQAAMDKSVLDFVLDDAGRLKAKVGKEDQLKVDEYLTSIREVERRIAANTGTGSTSPVCAPGQSPAAAAYRQNVGILYSLIAKALQCDMTRVVSYALQRALAGTAYNFLGDGFGDHHQVSHDSNPKLAQIVNWHIQQLATFLQTLKDSPEGAGNVLDNSIVFFGSQLSHGQGDHWHTDLPILLAGKGGGAVNPGRHVRFSTSGSYYTSHTLKGTRVANVHLAIAQAMGVKIDSFADSTGVAKLT